MIGIVSRKRNLVLMRDEGFFKKTKICYYIEKAAMQLTLTKNLLISSLKKQFTIDWSTPHCTKNWIYTNLLWVNMVQKSANGGEIKSKGGKYRICLPVYMEV